MIEKKCQVTGTAYKSLLKGLCDASQMDSAYALFDEMLEQGFPPDSFAYGLLIYGASKVGDVDKAMELFSEMKEKGCEPDSYSYRPLFHVLCKAKRAEMVLEVFNDMKGRGIEPDPVIFTIIVAGLCKLNKVAEAGDLFFSMVKDGFEPNDINIKALFSRIDEQGEGDVLSGGVKAYMPLLNNLRECGKISLLMILWETILEKGLFRWIEYSGREITQCAQAS